MLDFEVEVYDRVASAIIGEFPDAFVSGEHVEVPPSFPAVSIVETLSAEAQSRSDSSGDENAVNLTYTVNAYSDSVSDAKAVCKRIVSIASDEFRSLNMARTFARPIENAADPDIYRITARFTGQVDKRGIFYRR